MYDDESSGHATGIEPSSSLSVAAIRHQLGRILASPEFHATDRMRDLLRFIVEEKLAGRTERLNGRAIALSVFGRGEEFDSANDPIVRIQAGRLRRALERYYLTAGGDDSIQIDIPKGGYIPRFAALSAETDAVRASVGRELARQSTTDRIPSIAVLPFKSLDGDPDQLPLAAGLAEELVTELTRFQDIAVMSCNATRQLPGFPADAVEIGRSVGVRFALAGTIRRDGETVKVSAHLTDVKTGERIWAEAFTNPLEASRMIATQEQIVGSVVGAVASEFGIIARRLSSESRKKAPNELETYEAMLRYYDHQISPSPESAEICFAALHAASQREPEYGPLWSALATLYCQMYSFDVAGVDHPMETALEYARRGVFLEPGLPLLDRAISLNPCSPAWFHAGYAIAHLLQNDYERALAVTRTYHPFISFWDDVMIAAMLGRLERSEEALLHIEAIMKRKPDLTGRAGDLMRRSLKIDELVDDLVDGLRRAGLPD